MSRENVQHTLFKSSASSASPARSARSAFDELQFEGALAALQPETPMGTSASRGTSQRRAAAPSKLPA